MDEEEQGKEKGMEMFWLNVQQLPLSTEVLENG